jgi:hypothetical protein
MLQTWLSAAEQLIRNVVGNPGSQPDFYILVGVAVVALFAGMWLLEMAFGLSAASPARRLVGLFLVVLFGLLTGTAGALYLQPMATDPLTQVLLVSVSGALGVLLVAVPLYKLMLRTSYVKAVACVVGGFFLAAICIPLVISVMGTIRVGADNMRANQSRSRSVREGLKEAL